MTAIKLTKVIWSVTLGLFLGTGSAFATQDFSKLDKMPADLLTRLEEHYKALQALDDSDQSRGVYSTLEMWQPTYPRLRVCFFGGPQEMRALVAKTAKEWESDAISIGFDFGDMENPRLCGQGDGRDNQIRVGYSEPGYFSMYGQLAILIPKQNELSMNLSGFDKAPVDWIRQNMLGTIKHEFGHALGLRHEHQSPTANCDYDWEAIYTYLEGPPNNWPRNWTDSQMRPLDPTLIRGLMASDFDKDSIMLYQFDASFYKSGASSPCYIAAPNEQISRVDRAVLEYMYPANPQARMERFQKQKDAFLAIWNKASDKDKQGVAIGVVKRLVE